MLQEGAIPEKDSPNARKGGKVGGGSTVSRNRGIESTKIDMWAKVCHKHKGRCTFRKNPPNKKITDVQKLVTIFMAPPVHTRIRSELYNNLTTRTSPFYEEVIIIVKSGARQGDTTSPKFSVESIMRHLEWEDLGVKVDGRFLHHLRFADDIVPITPNIEQAERMLAEFDSACGKIDLRLNLTRTMLMRNELGRDAPSKLNGTNISECSSCVYPGREVNMMNDLAPELSRRKRAE
ncbi:hypothetical protein V3C99_001159 [Haemonchus contortus]|uniref:Reverse transcriptase domain-containing protein n=1 Tax=Haemonchus contortus TaxID=6289 RepID=A0A7I4YD36_HAECO